MTCSWLNVFVDVGADYFGGDVGVYFVREITFACTDCYFFEDITDCFDAVVTGLELAEDVRDLGVGDFHFYGGTDGHCSGHFNKIL
jgi:hypothetical protein